MRDNVRLALGDEVLRLKDALGKTMTSGARPEAMANDAIELAAVSRKIHFTASAAIRDEQGGCYLLIRQRIYDRWLFPGGHLEDGESFAECALREAVEEVGLPTSTDFAPKFITFDVHKAHANEGSEIIHVDGRFRIDVQRPFDLTLDETEVVSAAWIHPSSSLVKSLLS